MTGSPPPTGSALRIALRPGDPLVGVADAQLRIVVADAELEALVGGPAIGASLHDLTDDVETRRRLLLAAARVTPHVTVPLRTGAALLVRVGVVADRTWLMIHAASGGCGAAPVRECRVVGREAELDEVDRYLADSDPTVLYVRAPFGVGKTALLDAIRDRLDELSCPHFAVDARTAAPTEETVARALTAGRRVPDSTLDGLFTAVRACSPGRWVVLVDNFDAWQAVADQIPTRPFMHVPLDCRIIVAAREHPDSRWWGIARRSPRLLEMGPLSAEAGMDLAARAGVPAAKVRAVSRLSAGHPLCIVTLAAAIRADTPLERASVPLSRLTGLADLEVLEIAALPARITEDVLGALLDERFEAARAYDALRYLCLPDPSGIGLRMPHVVREALRGRMRERSPSRLGALRARLASYYGKLIEDGTPAYLYPAADDFLDSFDDHPVVRQLAGSRGDGLPHARRAGLHDRAKIAQAVRTMASAEAADAIVRRLELGFANTVVLEGDAGIEGVLQYTTPSGRALDELGDMNGDAELAAALEGLRRCTSVGPDDHAVLVLAFVSSEPADGSWGAGSRVFFRQLLHVILGVPRTVATAFVQYPSTLALATFAFPGAQSLVCGRREVVVRSIRDLRARSMFLMLVDSSDDRAPYFGGAVRHEPELTVDLVREALGAIGNPEKLAASPLVGLRIIDAEVGVDATRAQRAAALEGVLRSALGSIEGGTRESRERDALYAVFVEKSGKHEKIAADLGLPYSTFRRYVARGIDRIAEILRARECAVS